MAPDFSTGLTALPSAFLLRGPAASWIQAQQASFAGASHILNRRTKAGGRGHVGRVEPGASPPARLSVLLVEPSYQLPAP